MKLFNLSENRIKCGKCSTEFDMSKNPSSCPLCGFGKETTLSLLVKEQTIKEDRKDDLNVYLSIPPSLNLRQGKITVDEETRIWGSWLMFNDFFAPKFLARVLAWKIKKENREFIPLISLLKDSIHLIKRNGLSKLKGFPNSFSNLEDYQKDTAIGRLVNHFLRTATKMGLFEVKSIESKVKEIWKEKWENISVTLTKEGLKFAQLKNIVFDENGKEQVLSRNEIIWLIQHLQQIDREGYKEYSILKEVYSFLKNGHNGNRDLWNWFTNNQRFREYVIQISKRTKNDQKAFSKQINNYARSFASSKISLLRELGVVKDKRNDYTLVGEL